MPVVTNELGLPDAIVRAVANDDYDRGQSDITATELLDPPQKVYLTRKHADEIVEDASDRIYSLMGQAIHNVLERANVQDSVEDRLYATVNGWVIGGKYDHLAVEGGILTDYKTVSVWEIINGLKPEREQQLNVLAWLARQNGYKITRLEAVCIIRDWSKGEARRRGAGDYPQRQVVKFYVPMWNERRVTEFIRDRLDGHMSARDGDVAECSDEERWAKPDTWAVMKEGRKSSLRNLPSEAAATSWACDNKVAYRYAEGDEIHLNKGISIVHRPGENTRCLMYCAAAPFCSQWASIQEAAASEEEAA